MRFPILFLALCVLTAPVMAATVKVHPRGLADVTVPASQYINVFTAGNSSVTVSKQVGFAWAEETGGTFSNQEKIFGPYTAATVIRIQPGADPAFYSVGAGAIPVPVSLPSPGLSPSSGSLLRVAARLGVLQPVPTAKTVEVTLTAAELLTGIITGTHTAGATQAYTLPTGTLLEAAVPYLQIGEGFEWTLINLSAAAADSITVTAGTDHTIVGAPIVISAHVTTGGAITSMGNNSSTWITKKTAANTFVTYRKN